MNCEDSKLTIMEYLDGELAADARRELEDHIAGCEPCRQELAAQQRVIRSVQKLRHVPAPAGFAAGVADAVARANTPQANWRIWIVRYGAMAASIAIVVSAVLWMKTHPPAQRQRGSDYAAKSAPAMPESAREPGRLDSSPRAPEKADADLQLAMEEEAKAPQIAATPSPVPRELPAQTPDRKAMAKSATRAADSKAENVFEGKGATALLAERPKADQAGTRPATAPADMLPSKAGAKEVKAAAQPPAERAPAPVDAPAAAKPAVLAFEAQAEQAQFDLVVEADNVDRCVNELSALLERRHYKVIARISARHSVLLAEAQPVAAGKPKAATADAAGPAGLRSVIDEIAASGKFKIMGRAEAAKDADEKSPDEPRVLNAKQQVATQSDAGIGRIAIMIVSRNAPEATAAKEAQQNPKPAAETQNK